MSAGERAERKTGAGTWITIVVLLIATDAAWFVLPLREWLGLLERWITDQGIWGVALSRSSHDLAHALMAADCPEWVNCRDPALGGEG
jgi:hypothetical protein